MMKRLVLGAALCFFSFSLEAADSRYSTWSDPNAPQVQKNTTLDRFIKELRSMVNDAERGRAADPKFIRDLKKLAARYDISAMVPLFHDDFIDGNFTSKPAWKLLSGKYWVERGYGLRSFVEPGNTSTTQAQPEQGKVSNEELVIGLLGAILGGKTTRTTAQPETKTVVNAAQVAEIHLPKSINNAFEIKIDLSSWKEKGQFEFGPYQGTNLKTGYRLIYRAGKSPALQLVRNYASGSSIIDQVQTLKLEDQKTHQIILSRTVSGEMKVRVDGKTLMQTTDRSFRDDFSGLIMTNRTGDFIVKSVSVSGAR